MQALDAGRAGSRLGFDGWDGENRRGGRRQRRSGGRSGGRDGGVFLIISPPDVTVKHITTTRDNRVDACTEGPSLTGGSGAARKARSQTKGSMETTAEKENCSGTCGPLL